VYWLQDFEKVLFEMMTHARLFTSIRMNITEVETETREARFVKWWKDNIQHIPSQKQPILQRIRSVKESEERPYTTSMYHYRKRIQKSSVSL
jgi:Xaa-Pro aminopeptidase